MSVVDVIARKEAYWEDDMAWNARFDAYMPALEHSIMGSISQPGELSTARPLKHNSGLHHRGGKRLVFQRRPQTLILQSSFYQSFSHKYIPCPPGYSHNTEP